MTGGGSTVLSTLGRETKRAIRESLGDAVRLTVGVLVLATGLALLGVGFVQGSLLVATIGAVLSILGIAGLCVESAAVAWLRDRHRGRQWRWS